MTTDARHVENLSALPEGRSLTPSSRVIDHEQRDVTVLSTAAEAAMFRRGMGVVSCLGSSSLANRQDYEAERCTDITVPVRERHTQMVSTSKAQEEICMDQEAVPATMNKSGLQKNRKSSAKMYRRQARCWSGLMAPGVEIQCRASRYLLVLVD